jgi:hypothetical protein
LPALRHSHWLNGWGWDGTYNDYLKYHDYQNDERELYDKTVWGCCPSCSAIAHEISRRQHTAWLKFIYKPVPKDLTEKAGLGKPPVNPFDSMVKSRKNHRLFFSGLKGLQGGQGRFGRRCNPGYNKSNPGPPQPF